MSGATAATPRRSAGPSRRPRSRAATPARGGRCRSRSASSAEDGQPVPGVARPGRGRWVTSPPRARGRPRPAGPGPPAPRHRARSSAATWDDLAGSGPRPPATRGDPSCRPSTPGTRPRALRRPAARRGHRGQQRHRSGHRARPRRATGSRSSARPAASTGSRHWPARSAAGRSPATSRRRHSVAALAARGRPAPRRAGEQRRRRLRLGHRRGRGPRGLAADVRGQRARPRPGHPGAAAGAARERVAAWSSTSAPPRGGSPTPAAAATPRPSTAPQVVTETLRLELNGEPIRVTEIAPGMVHTEEFSLVRFGGDRDRAEAVYADVDSPLRGRGRRRGGPLGRLPAPARQRRRAGDPPGRPGRPAPAAPGPDLRPLTCGQFGRPGILAPGG